MRRPIEDDGVESAAVRQRIVALKKYKFDEMDVDWEFSAANGGAPSDKELNNNF